MIQRREIQAVESAALLLAVIALAGCATPKPTYQEVYDRCLQGREAHKPKYHVAYDMNTPLYCEMAARETTETHSLNGMYSGELAEEAHWKVRERQRQDRQELFNHCLSHAVLPFHCSY